jgi:hypothetical protein
LIPPLFSFRHFQTAGDLTWTTDLFHVKVSFWLRAIMDRSVLSDADVASARPSFPRKPGGVLPWGERLVEVALPTTTAGFPSRPPPPEGSPPLVPRDRMPALFTVRPTHRPPHHLAPREKSWAVGVPIRCWHFHPFLFWVCNVHLLGAEMVHSPQIPVKTIELPWILQIVKMKEG